MKEFSSWLLENNFIRIVDDSLRVEGSKVLTDGIWDVKKFIAIEFAKYAEWTDDLRMMTSLFSEWIDIRKVFHTNYDYDSWNISIESMLHFFGFQFDGRQHCGLDDARNLSRVVLRILNDNIKIECTDKTKFQCGDSNAKERHIRYSDEVFRRVTQELKSLNKILSLDAKHNPYSSHNLFTSYHFVGELSDLQNLVKGFRNTPSVVLFSIRSQKKGTLTMFHNNVERTKYPFYEESSPQSDEFFNCGDFCTFRRSTFKGTMFTFKQTFLTATNNTDEVVHLTLCLEKSYKLTISKDVSFKGNFYMKQQQKEFTPAVFIEKIHARSELFKEFYPNLEPPSQFYIEEWISWRLRLLSIRKQLNAIKLCRRDELMNAFESLRFAQERQLLKIQFMKYEKHQQSIDCHFEYQFSSEITTQGTSSPFSSLCW